MRDWLGPAPRFIHTYTYTRMYMYIHMRARAQLVRARVTGLAPPHLYALAQGTIHMRTPIVIHVHIHARVYMYTH